MADMFSPTANSKSFRMKTEMKPFGNQLVDIIVPFYGQYDSVSKLMESLIYHTSIVNFRVCVIDDCSPNVIFHEAAFEVFPNVKVVRNTSRLGFGASLEVGIKTLEKEKKIFPWLVFMHSDVVIEDPNWLLFLGQTMLNLKDKGVKMVSATTNNTTTNNPYLEAKSPEKREDIVLENGYLPLYCSLCHRELFNKIKGYVKHYPYMGYEDRELANRMRHYGFKQGISGKSWVRHNGASTLKAQDPGIIKIIENNKNLWNEDVKNLNPKHR
jgi:GT2 family glycosyltransferase